MKTVSSRPVIELMELSPAACCPPIAKPDITPADAEITAKLFKALSDPHRVRIVNLLANSKAPVCVCDLTSQLDLSQPTVSFHLKKLMNAGLLDRAQRGTWAYYTLKREALKQLSRTFAIKGGSK